MKIKFLVVLSVVSLCSGLSNAEVFEVDTSMYFAYYKLPDSQSGSLRTISPYIFLSKEHCLASAVENEDAMQAISYYPITGQIRNECWARFSEKIVICPVGKTKTGKLGTACLDISIHNFIDTSSLPASPDF